MKATITVRLVDAMEPGTMIWDDRVPGFVVRCQRRAKVYGLKYRAGGRQRWFTIGKHGVLTPELARKEARRLLGVIASGGDPASVRALAGAVPTVADVAERFLAEHVDAKRKQRTAAGYRDILCRLVVPAIGKMRISDVQRADVSRLHHDLRETPYQANRVLAVLAKMFSLAEEWGYREGNPCRGVEKFRERKRERFLSPVELAALGAALDAWRGSPYAAAAIRLLVLTGARLNEVLTLRWEWVDIARCEARLPDSKTGAKTLHFPPPAMVVLKDLPRIEGNPFVIVGARTGAHIINLSAPWRVIRKDAGLSGVRLHDLRHAFASVAVASGFGLPIIGKILGHSQPATTARYAHLADDPVKAAQAAVAASIDEAMRGR